MSIVQESTDPGLLLHMHVKGIVISEGQQVSMKCNFVLFQKHPDDKQRAVCGCIENSNSAVRSKNNVSAEGIPIQKLAFIPLTTPAMPKFYRFVSAMAIKITCGRIHVDDGKLWNDFKVVGGKPFLSSQDTLGLGLMLNVD